MADAGIQPENMVLSKQQKLAIASKALSLSCPYQHQLKLLDSFQHNNTLSIQYLWKTALETQLN